MVPLPSYQEFYELKADKSFRKYRSDGWEAFGTYSEKTSEEGAYLELVYTDSQISGSCTMGKTYLHKSEQGMLVESSLACDGDILYFEKKSE